MNFTEKKLPLNALELSDLRKDFWQGWIGVAVIEVIGIGFSFLFSNFDAKVSTVGFWFGLSPFILTNFVAFYIGYQLINYWRDLKNGQKILIRGTIDNKFYKIRNSNGSSTLTSIYDRTNHYIVVNKTRYLIDGRDYAICSIGAQVRMYVTPYGKRVYEIQFF